MIALGLCAAAALFCVLLPRRDGVTLGPEPDMPTLRTPQSEPRPVRDVRAAPAVLANAERVATEPSGGCEPVASFDETPAARAVVAPSMIETAQRDDDVRACADVAWSGCAPSARDDERGFAASMCGPSEL